MFSLVVLAGCHSPKPPSMRGHVELIAPKAFSFQEQATYQSTLESISNVAMAAEIDGRPSISAAIATLLIDSSVLW